MSPKRRRHRATDKRVERTEERTSVGEGSAAQRYAAFQEHARAASSLRGRWVAGLSFTPDPFQLDALDAVEAGNSVLVAAPTGAGKTIVGQFGAYVALQRGMRAFYTTPIKALSNQKYLELCDLYGADNVGLATGDTSINSKAPVVIMTTEVCRNMIYAGASLDDLGVVVLDEVHYLADKMRGPVWEEVIIHLPAHVSIIALSATVSNAEEFGAWIREVRSSCEIIVSEQRPVPLYQHMIVGEDIFDLYAPTGKRKLNPELVAATNDSRMRGGRGSRSWNRPVRVRRESRPSTLISLDRAHLLPAITFIFSRAGCEDAVRQVLLTRITLTTRSEAAEIERYVDEVIALIRRSPTVDEARAGLIELLDVDAIQADAILALQLRRLAALERQKIMDEHAELKARVDDLNDILAKPERQRAIISAELGEIVDKFGDERRTRILPFDGEMSMEDLIPEEDVVVTITRDGFAKRTRTDNYRSQKRGGKGVRGTQLRGDDVVEHFFVTTTHNWLLFFTNLGRVYRAKAYEIPEGGRDAKGQHVANLLAFQPDEHIAQVLAIRTYEDADFLVLATKRGLVKKTPLSLYNSPRSGGIIAINLREDEDGKPDELVSAQTIMADEDLILVSRDGQAVRFTATDDQLRSMGRSTSGVRGMKFRGDDELLSMEVPRENTDLLIVTESGYAKRTPVEEYPTKSRGTLGVRVGKLVDERGGLVGALVVRPDEDVMVITESGKLVQVNASDVRPTARNTMGVIFARPDDGDRIIAITRNSDSGDEDETDESENTEAVEGAEVAEATDAPADEATAPAGGDDTADADK